MSRLGVFQLAAALLVATSGGTQAQWERFRGPQDGVTADDPRLPERWSETENVVWKVDLPGLSWSSPIVTGNHVFVTSAVSTGEEPEPIPGLYDPGDHNGAARSSAVHSFTVTDIDFGSGRVRWQRELHRGVDE